MGASTGGGPVQFHGTGRMAWLSLDAIATVVCVVVAVHALT